MAPQIMMRLVPAMVAVTCMTSCLPEWHRKRAAAALIWKPAPAALWLAQSSVRAVGRDRI